jgi:uncharacterized membrane protein YfcA
MREFLDAAEPYVKALLIASILVVDALGGFIIATDLQDWPLGLGMIICTIIGAAFVIVDGWDGKRRMK